MQQAACMVQYNGRTIQLKAKSNCSLGRTVSEGKGGVWLIHQIAECHSHEDWTALASPLRAGALARDSQRPAQGTPSHCVTIRAM